MEVVGVSDRAHLYTNLSKHQPIASLTDKVFPCKKQGKKMRNCFVGHSIRFMHQGYESLKSDGTGTIVSAIISSWGVLLRKRLVAKVLDKTIPDRKGSDSLLTNNSFLCHQAH